MPSIREELVKYGCKIAQAGLVAGAGGNISARDGRMVCLLTPAQQKKLTMLDGAHHPLKTMSR